MTEHEEALLQEMRTLPGEFIEEIMVMHENRDGWEYDGDFASVEDARAHCARRLAFEQRTDNHFEPRNRKIVRRIVFERALEELPV